MHRRPAGDRQQTDRRRPSRMTTSQPPPELRPTTGALLLGLVLAETNGRPAETRSRSLHVYWWTSDNEPLRVASGCTPLKCRRGPVGHLSCTYCWWQVPGSKLRRSSRRFYRGPEPLTGSHLPPGASACLAQRDRKIISRISRILFREASTGRQACRSGTWRHSPSAT